MANLGYNYILDSNGNGGVILDLRDCWKNPKQCSNPWLGPSLKGFRKAYPCGIKRLKTSACRRQTGITQISARGGSAFGW